MALSIKLNPRLKKYQFLEDLPCKWYRFHTVEYAPYKSIVTLYRLTC